MSPNFNWDHLIENLLKIFLFIFLEDLLDTDASGTDISDESSEKEGGNEIDYKSFDGVVQVILNERIPERIWRFLMAGTLNIHKFIYSRNLNFWNTLDHLYS